MPKNYNFYVYIMSGINRVIYIGVTNDLIRRAEEHRQELIDGFTKRYKCYKLVYYEHFSNIKDAIRREKQLKGWGRDKKVKLIESLNPDWNDLYEILKGG